MKIRNIFWITLAVFVLNTGVCAADQQLTYHYFDEATKEVKEVHTIKMKDMGNDQMQIMRKVDTDGISLEDEMVIDKNGDTLRWTVKDDDLGLDYVGENKDGKLILKGTNNGEPFEKEIELDGRPFFFTPKYNLVPFAASSAEEIKFWMLRKDELTRYLMQAKKKEIMTIDVNGKDVEAVKVYYSATGIAEKFYKRNYYFRPADGAFLKKTAPKKADSLTAELVEEK